MEGGLWPAYLWIIRRNLRNASMTGVFPRRRHARVPEVVMPGRSSLLRRLRKLVCDAGQPSLCGISARKTWMAGTSPAMTEDGLESVKKTHQVAWVGPGRTPARPFSTATRRHQLDFRFNQTWICH